MSKKLAVLMAIICAGLIAFVVWTRVGADKKGPEIKCNNGDLVYQDGMTDLELLEGVTAYDEKDGDVTDSLAVESAYPVENGQVVVVYVAKDKSNNITKSKQFYAYDAAASADTGNEEEPDAEAGADGEASPEADDSQASDTENTADVDSAGNAAEPSVSDAASSDAASSEAEQRRQEQEAAAEQMPAGSPRIYLTDYMVKVPVGTTVDRLSYVKEITDDSDNVYDLWTKIQIMGTLDTMTAGTYECTYYVVDSQGNTSNQAVLQFIVE